MSKKRTKLPKYANRIMEILDAHQITQKPRLHHLKVLHEDWCALLAGKGECNCNPDVEYAGTEGQN